MTLVRPGSGTAMPLAALPMYDLPELRPATDALWAAIAARLAAARIGAPAALTRGMDLDQLWSDPNLLLAQTCGYPLVTSLHGRVALVATPRYLAEGCEGAFYRSAIVARAGDPARTLAELRGRICAVNDPASNSGMNLLRQAILPLAEGHPFFADIVWTGAHVASVQAVAEQRADVAAIDCVTWAHLGHLRPQATAGLRVLDWTAATPGLPLITSARTDAATLAALRAALDDVARDPALAPVRAALRIDGFERLGVEAYGGLLAVSTFFSEEKNQKTFGGLSRFCPLARAP